MTKTITPLFRPALLVLGVALLSAAPVQAEKTNRGLESVNQPVVQRTDFVFDAVADGNGGLSASEKRRLGDWFNAIALGYGDRVSVVDEELYGRSHVADAVAALVANYGLLMADQAPRTVGDAPPGSVRVVVSHTVATVPGCPDWKDHMEADIQGGLSYNYGCATNGNLAAMIANPEDLLHGANTGSNLRGATSSRAIKAFNAATPSGAGGTLK